MSDAIRTAPGSPGIPARWTSSAKSGIGKALNPLSNVSFTLSHGIINEIYFPREDQACTRDMELLVTDGKDFFSEEKRHTVHTTGMIADGIPAYQITNECVHKRYRIEKEVITDPLRNTVLQKIKFVPLKGILADYHVYVLLAPHLGNQGAGNTGWIADHKGVPMLFAARENHVLALACSAGWLKRSVGFVGVSDGWTDLEQHKRLTWEYQRAESGNLALVAEINLGAGNTFVLALGFGFNPTAAAHYARASLLKGYADAHDRYTGEWKQWQDSLAHQQNAKSNTGRLSPMSAAILRMHEAKYFAGATIASMSIPWGFSKGDHDIGGYHLVWPRDLVETAGGFLAMNTKEDAWRVTNYLMSTQESDGHWCQNMWIDGRPNLEVVQMDQTALPVLLIDLCRRYDALKPDMSSHYWEIVKKAISYLLHHGPFTCQDRWEEESGLSPFTLAAEIAALLVAADFADEKNEPEIATFCRQTADDWNDHIEYWNYVTGTPLAKEVGVDGYYIRTNPTGIAAKDLGGQTINLKNHRNGQGIMLINELVCVDALALVRFGLRSADDPRILNTVRVIDAKLKVETPHGPCWHRYNNDGYGELENGQAFDGAGIGRTWPLLTGERAHYEIAAGHMDRAEALMKTMESFSNHDLLSEQIWDATDIPERDLYFGKHSGSAMPLIWAHAEYIKLCYSLMHKKVFDMPEQTQQRYIKNRTRADRGVWRFSLPCSHLSGKKYLRVETLTPARVHWSADGWKTVSETATRDTGLNIYVADLPCGAGGHGDIRFTFYWQDAQCWENRDFRVETD